MTFLIYTLYLLWSACVSFSLSFCLLLNWYVFGHSVSSPLLIPKLMQFDYIIFVMPKLLVGILLWIPWSTKWVNETVRQKEKKPVQATLMNQLLLWAAGTSGRAWRTSFSIPIPQARKLVHLFRTELSLAALTPYLTGLPSMEAEYTPATREIPRAESQVLAVGKHWHVWPW